MTKIKGLRTIETLSDFEFEMEFKVVWDNYVRLKNLKTGKSEIHKLSTNLFECFEPSKTGEFKSVLDDTMFKRLELPSNKSYKKAARQSSGASFIRDNFWESRVSNKSNAEKGKYNKTPKVWDLDIETRVGQNSKGFPVPEKALEEVSLIQIFDRDLNTCIAIGIKPYKYKEIYDKIIQKSKDPYQVKYIQVKNEIEIFERFFSIIKKLNPLIIYAWSGNGFDFPYIYNRIKSIGLNVDELSATGHADCVSLKEDEYKGKYTANLKVAGSYWMDLKDVYQKFTYTPLSGYGIDHVAFHELGYNKVQHPEYDGFDNFYLGNYNIPKKPTEAQLKCHVYQTALKGNIEDTQNAGHSLFIYYGCNDCFLMKAIDNKNNFTGIMIMLAEIMGVNIDVVLGTVKMWSQTIRNSLYEMGIIPIKFDIENEDEEIVGGFVKKPVPGRHKWVLSGDVNSMYPMLCIVACNMSPETYVPLDKLDPEFRQFIMTHFKSGSEQEQDENTWLEIRKTKPELIEQLSHMLKERNYSMAINGAVFRQDEVGFIPELVQIIYSTRKEVKSLGKKAKKLNISIKDVIQTKGE